ncbi:MAG: cytochrome d ubiquinol oxidase subunit II [Deltaproteobacteria bacterium]|nr:cytochrome d ubiquinol oxidase subunit II [Deltaproteobacteria bacterium]
MPDPATLSAGCILASLVLYALFGGADFGGGVWDLLARNPGAADRRRLIASAIGPVWETNHIWLIVAIVILFTAFPGAFAVVCTTLFVPLTIVLAGIVLRGAAFAFHAYRLHEERGAGRWGAVFASASLVTPVFLGVVFGAISSGRIRATEPLAFTGDVTLWLSPFPVVVGFLTLASFAFLAAVYLIHETDDPGLREKFRRDSFRSAAALVFLSGLTMALATVDAPQFFRALTGGTWSIPLLAAEIAAAAGAIASLALRRYPLARACAAAQVSLLLVGWGMAQYPYLVRPDITVFSASASPRTLRLLLGVLAAGAVLLFPAVFLLLRVFKWEAISGTPRRP